VNTDQASSNLQAVGWMAAGVALSLVGLVVHNWREFGLAGVLALENGVIPMVMLALGALGVWWVLPGGQRFGAIVLVALGLLHLIGGAVISVLPLGFLPFEPEQSVSHYVSHVFYGVTQLPMIALALWQVRA
jgi:hypothetical protein